MSEPNQNWPNFSIEQNVVSSIFYEYGVFSQNSICITQTFWVWLKQTDNIHQHFILFLRLNCVSSRKSVLSHSILWQCWQSFIYIEIKSPQCKRQKYIFILKVKIRTRKIIEIFSIKSVYWLDIWKLPFCIICFIVKTSIAVFKTKTRKKKFKIYQNKRPVKIIWITVTAQSVYYRISSNKQVHCDSTKSYSIVSPKLRNLFPTKTK